MSRSVVLNNGDKMPLVGLGTFAATGEVMKETLRTALECGYRSIDTAYLYLNEDAIGEELHLWLSKGKLTREEVYVTSKLPCIGNKRQDVNRFLKLTLKALKLDYLDLYLIHSPFAFKGTSATDVEPRDVEGNMILDNTTDLEEIWKGMEEQVDLGLVKAIGISNFNSEQVERIMKVARIVPAVSQVEAHVYMQQKPLSKLCQQHGIHTCAYGPLGAPYRDQDSTDEFPLLIQHPKVLEIASHHKKSTAQVLLKYLLQIGIIVIPKSATPARIRQNLQLFDFSLCDKEMKDLDRLDRAEKGRVLDFTGIFKGIKNHKEYPFHIPF